VISAGPARLSHFLRRAPRFPGPGSAWTVRYQRWLHALGFADRASRRLSATTSPASRRSSSEDLRRRQAGQDPRVCEIAWRAQRRF
jgi:hypothetical protein